ncbi:MAG TPA: ABC transporter permease [Exilispira sp.]|nr:ABC transporter permease [Exilispira sp.]
MVNYIIRKLLNLIPILLGCMIIFFLLFNVIGGQDKVLYNMLPSKSRTPEQIKILRHKYGLDKPLYLQYFDYIKQAVTMDFGSSLSKKQPINKLIKRCVPVSLAVTFPPFVLDFIFATALALVCAFNRGKFLDKLLTVLSTIFIAFPYLALIILFQTFFAGTLRLFPISGWANDLSAIRYLILPWILIIISGLGGDVRYYRTVFVEEVNKDYVRTAKAKGLSTRKIMFTHVLKNALIPILTNVIISIPYLFTGALLTERFFSIPGIGDLTVTAVQSYDLPVLKAMVVIYTLFFIVFSLITDISYSIVDPRVKLS